MFWRAGVTGVLAMALGGTAPISARSLHREWPNSSEQVQVLRCGPTAGLDHEIDADLMAGKGYHLIANPQANSSFGQASWWVWQRN